MNYENGEITRGVDTVGDSYVNNTFYEDLSSSEKAYFHNTWAKHFMKHGRADLVIWNLQNELMCRQKHLEEKYT